MQTTFNTQKKTLDLKKTTITVFNGGFLKAAAMPTGTSITSTFITCKDRK